MAFEFFFGVFGLISGDSKARLKSRLDGDWRLFTPLGASLFRDAKSHKSSSPLSHNSYMNSADSGQHKPIFSTSGTLANANISVSEGVFSSNSSSSASSIVSSGSANALIKPSSPLDPISSKKYEFMDPKSGEAAAGTLNLISSNSSSSGSGSGNSSRNSSKVAQLHSGSSSSSDTGNLKEEVIAPSSGRAPESEKKRSFRAIYCRLVCLCLWFNVLRLLVGLVLERSLITLDFYYLGAFRIHFLIPALCLAIQVAAVSSIFIRNNDETNWLVPFYSNKDYLIRSRSNFRPKIEDYTKRVRISVSLALVLALMSAVSLPAYLIHSIMHPAATAAGESVKRAAVATLSQSSSIVAGSSSSSMALWSFNVSHLGISQVEKIALIMLLAYDVFWAIYSTYICFLVSFYFNLICSIMKSRFHGISKIIEDLAESNTSKTTNQARKITTLYLEHNEACELLDESNEFWQYLIFFTYFTYIPAYCYCLYNLFFVDFDTWPSFITWVIHNHTGFIILLISFSAAGVSTEAHAPYTSLHTLSLIQLPLDVEVNTAAACASYFLIVADFSRSSVFTLAQMNGTGGENALASAAAAAAAASGSNLPVNSGAVPAAGAPV